VNLHWVGPARTEIAAPLFVAYTWPNWMQPMCLNWPKRLLAVFTAIIVSAMLLSAARPSRAQTPVPSPLVGQLLVASPAIRDLRFDHAVILVIHHDQDGTMGLIINMPVQEMPWIEVFKMLGEKDTNVSGNVQVFAGGPVQPNIGFVIHSPDYRGPGTINVDKDVRMTTNGQILRDIANHKGPNKSIVAFGYAGWAGGQLENEMQHGIWFTASGDPKLIFDEDRDKVWNIAYSRRIQEL
jgi:putative transcriptional regulator